jgi:hypothetical protein
MIRIQKTKSAADHGGRLSLPGRALATASSLLQPHIGRLRSGHGGAELLTRCCGKPMDREENDGSGSGTGTAISHHADRSHQARLVRCCLVGTTTSSLALRATAKGGCGLDLAVPTRPLASKRSTDKGADVVGAIPPREKTACLLIGD